MNGIRTLSDGNGTIIKNGTIITNDINTTNINCDTITSQYLQNEIDNLQTQIDGIDASGIQTHFNTIDGEITTINSNIATINTEISDMSGNIFALQTQQNINTTNIATINTEITTINTDIADIYYELDIIGDVSGNLATLETQVNTNTDSIGYLNSDFSNLQSQLNGFVGDLSTLDTQVADLSNDASSNTYNLTGITYSGSNITTITNSITNGINQDYNTYSYSGFTKATGIMDYSNQTYCDISVGSVVVNPYCNLKFSFKIPVNEKVVFSYTPVSPPFVDPYETDPFSFRTVRTNITLKTYDTSGNYLVDIPFTQQSFYTFADVSINTRQYSNQYYERTNSVLIITDFKFPYISTSQTYNIKVRYYGTLDQNPPENNNSECVAINSWKIYTYSDITSFSYGNTITASQSFIVGYTSQLPTMTGADVATITNYIDIPTCYINSNYRYRYGSGWFNVAINTTYTFDLTNDGGLSFKLDNQVNNAYFDNSDYSAYIPVHKVLYRTSSSATRYYDITGQCFAYSYAIGYCLAWENARQIKIRTADTYVASYHDFGGGAGYTSSASGQYKIILL